MADCPTTAKHPLRRATLAGMAAVRATAQWTLFFAISFSVTAGFLLLAHV